MLSWGMNGPSTSYTSNHEYGRGVLMAMQQQRQDTPGNRMNNFPSGWNPNAININSQMSSYPAFTPGQSHQPTCQNYGAGSYGQAQGHVHSPTCPNHGQVQGQMMGATGGVYSTGGNSPTDFTVFVGDAATALGQGAGGQEQSGQDQSQSNQQDYKVNYYMPEQSNVSEGGPAGNFAMNYQNSGAGDQTGQIQNQQQYFSGTPQDGGAQITDGTAMANSSAQKHSKSMRTKAFSRANNRMGTPPGAYGYPNQTMSMADMMTPASSTISKGLGNKYKNRLGGTASTDSIPRQHVYSSLRGNHESNPGFQLCGRCSKCKDLKDPNSGRPSVVNFKTQGLTPSGGRRFPIPAAAKPQATPSLSSMSGNMVLGNNAVSNTNFNQAMPATQVPAMTLPPVIDTTTTAPTS